MPLADNIKEVERIAGEISYVAGKIAEVDHALGCVGEVNFCDIKIGSRGSVSMPKSVVTKMLSDHRDTLLVELDCLISELQTLRGEPEPKKAANTEGCPVPMLVGRKYRTWAGDVQTLVAPYGQKDCWMGSRGTTFNAGYGCWSDVVECEELTLVEEAPNDK